jgi:hypothetical protein
VQIRENSNSFSVFQLGNLLQQSLGCRHSAPHDGPPAAVGPLGQVQAETELAVGHGLSLTADARERRIDGDHE